MKKFLLGIALVFGTLFIVIVIKLCFFPAPITLDGFSHLNIVFEGQDGKGTAKVSGNDFAYSGNDQDILEFLETVEYEIEPNTNLNNYDSVTVTLKFSEDDRKKANVEFKSREQIFKVAGLEVSEEQKAKTTENIDGVDIPKSWELSEEEKQAYVDYVHGLEADENETLEEQGVQAAWEKGTATEETKKENKKFYTKDYNGSSTVAYKRANEYGMTSSQEFRVIPFVSDEGVTKGYECIFKENEK